jgi:septum formation protein
MEPRPRLVLASASPRRISLLRQLCSDFEVHPAEVDEITSDSRKSPEELVIENARLKAQAVAEFYPDQMVLGADTVVALKSQIFGKPRTFEEAESMLETLNGREHAVFTGVCLVRKSSGEERTFAESTRVRFRNLTSDQRRAYLQRIHPLDKAGAYAAQDDEGELIQSLSGSLSNVIGLPLEALAKHLTASRP